jgi:hypothetical protein
VPPNVEVFSHINQGSATAGQVVLTTANGWYAVPNVSRTLDYTMVVAVETGAGTVRWSYSNVGTPGATNGLQAPSVLCVKLSADQVIYYGSSTASDSVNYTIKEI